MLTLQPKLLGMCSLTLKSVLKSDALFLDNTLEVKDRSQGSISGSTAGSTLKESDWPLVGLLKVCDFTILSFLIGIYCC